MSAPSICYVIATWHKSRQNPEPERPEEYLKAQVAQLSTLKHSLSKIVFAHPGPMNSLYKSFFHPINIPFEYEIIEDKTERRSYGSWINTFKRYKTQYDYYIFIEDDYVPVTDNFDKILVDILEAKQCGYLCGWCGPDENIHAAISNGIVKSSVLEQIYNKNWAFVPFGFPESYPGNQIGFSQAFIRNGLSIEDHTDQYNSSYWESGLKKIIKVVDIHDKYLIVPVQQFWKRDES